MNIQKITAIFTKMVPYPNLKSSEIQGEWKNRLLLILLGSFVLLSPFVYIPSTIYAFKIGNWTLFALNTLIIVVIFIIAFSKKLPPEIKVKVSIGTFYLLGIAVLLLLGPLSSGLIWMFLFIILAGLFYGYKGILFTEIISCTSLILLSIPIYFQSDYTLKLNLYGFDAWLVNIILFTTISLFISSLLTEIILNIEDSLKKEQKITVLLQDNQKNLTKEKNHAEEADMLKSKFLANMSHEIRTPLNSILGFTSLMAEPGLDNETLKNFHNIIKTSGDQLLRIISDIIDISKIESNLLTIHLQSVNVNECLNDIIKIAQNKITTLHKNLVISLDTDKKLTHLFLETDEMRFKQIIGNLIDNSIKYSSKGTITVGYHFVSYKKRAAIEFFVKDTGRGIPDDALESIFDRFAQAKNIGFHEGTGLGLSIVKGLLELLGGTIRVESELNHGSTFYVILPYEEKIISRKAKNPAEGKRLFPDYSGKTFFIAEDDITSFYYLKEVFKSTNVQIEHAVNGKDLLDMLEKKLPDLILLDINMPVMNGFDAMLVIREKYKNLKVIAQTAYAMEEEKQKCLELGCDSYIAKPINRAQLFETIDQLLNN